MDWAKDRVRSRTLAARLVAPGLLGCLVALPAGCSEFYGGRSSESPRVGSVPSPAADPYLARQSPTANPPAPAGAITGPELVRSTAHPVPNATSPGLAANRQPPVAAVVPGAGATTTAPVARAPSDPLAEAKAIVVRSRARLESMSTYQVHLNRQESVGGQLQPTEDVLLSIRRDPKAVRLEWPTGPSKGREVIFSSTDPRGLLHVHMGNPLVPPVSMRPDSPLVMRNSRHPITEAGFSTIIENLEKGLAGQTPGARIAYHGIETPEAVGRPCHQIVRTTPSGDYWMVFIDQETALPAMVAETTKTGELLERYIFRDVVANVPALSSPDAFDPDKRWTGASGLLGRFARSASGDAKTTATPAP